MVASVPASATGQSPRSIAAYRMMNFENEPLNGDRPITENTPNPNRVAVNGMRRPLPARSSIIAEPVRRTRLQPAASTRPRITIWKPRCISAPVSPAGPPTPKPINT